jgi:HEAT repeat protein
MVRADVAWALGRMSSREVIDPLVELVEEEAPTVRYTAADGLARTANRLIAAGKESRREGGLAALSARQPRNAARRKV